MMRIGIIDADIASCNSLQKLLEENFPEVEVIAATTSAEEGMRMIRSYLPDLIFVDMQLQRITGFELLEELDDLKMDVVFTTVYPIFQAPKSRIGKIEILLKPITLDSLQNAISHLEKVSVYTRRAR